MFTGIVTALGTCPVKTTGGVRLQVVAGFEPGRWTGGKETSQLRRMPDGDCDFSSWFDADVSQETLRCTAGFGRERE
jgi:hypothetical protein